MEYNLRTKITPDKEKQSIEDLLCHTKSFIIVETMIYLIFEIEEISYVNKIYH